MKRSTAIGGCIVASFLVAGAAVSTLATTLAEFNGVQPDRIESGSFRLDSTAEVRVTSRGFGFRSGGNRIVLNDAWILDSQSRTAVWHLLEQRSEWKKLELTQETHRVELPAGEYEVYFSTYPVRRHRKWGGGDIFALWNRRVERAVDKMLSHEGLDDVEDVYRQLSLRVEGDGVALGKDGVRAIHDRIFGSAIVSIFEVGDHEYVERGFELKRAMKIRIYSVGEARKDGVYDAGWIVDVKTGKRVWKFTYDDSYRAGGASKNRVVDSKFEAPAGRYVAVYATDGSHSYGNWNASPPFDPSFWGMTVTATDPADSKYTGTFAYEGTKFRNVVVDLTKVGDDEFVHAGFALKKPMDLRVYAVGEGRDGEMYDGGWIVDATTRERVWEMKYDDTEHAGGADKNRVFDGTIHFDAGRYVVYFGTDDSHAYPHWNAEPPRDRERWGITVVGADGYDKRSVTRLEGDENGGVLAQITGVGDDEYLHESFSLKSDTRVYVEAVGEGTEGRMYDYGWIEDAKSGTVVWEMSYRKTRHAGGSQKNRMVSDTIVLKPGTYDVFYESDDSHSARHWNAPKPYEPDRWGIIVRAASNG